MNKKVLIIGGGVLLLGGIAYLYFTNNKKQEALLSGSATPTTSGATTPTTTSSTTSAVDSQIKPLFALDTKYTQEDANFDKAKEVVTQILKPHSSPFMKRILKTKYIQQLQNLGYAYDEKSETLTKL
jgi:hypothetical protein